MDAESLWLTTAQTAARINRSEDYVRRKLRYIIPCHQAEERGELRFFSPDVDRWMASTTHEPVR
jgi:hypothetical protein